MPTARKERKGLEIEKGAFRLREMESVWGLKSRKGAKFLKLKRGRVEDLYSCNIICHTEYSGGGH